MLFYCISDMGENGKVAELLNKSFLTLPTSSTSTIFIIIQIIRNYNAGSSSLFL